MSRIVWTKAEKALISDELERIFAGTPWKTNLDALREAQRILPSERHVVVDHARAWSHKERIRLARAASGRVLKKRAEAEKALQEKIDVAVATGIARPAPEPKEGTTARLARVFDEILDILADKVAQRLQQPGVSISTKAMPLPERVKHNPEPPSAPRVAKTGVLVIGLLGDQVEALPIYNTLDITFLPTEQALSKDYVRRAYTILMTKFINHAVQDKYRKANNLHYCNGGTSDLARILISIAIKEDQALAKV